MLTLTIALSGVLGLVVGSFLNVVAYRVPAGLSVVHPPSACPACGTEIKPYDNIPVLSWFILRGKCRACGEPFSIRYAVVEAATAALFALTTAVIGLHWTLPGYLWFMGVTIVLVLTDFDHKRIPNRILYPGIVVGALLLAVGGGIEGEWSALGRGGLAAVACFLGYLVLALVVPGAFGMGDVKLAILLGLFAGYQSWASVVAGVFLAQALGGVVAMGIARGPKSRNEEQDSFRTLAHRGLLAGHRVRQGDRRLVPVQFLILFLASRCAYWYASANHIFVITRM